MARLIVMTDIYLGVDFSLTSTGIALYDGKEWRYELLKPKAKGIDRLQHYYDSFLDILSTEGLRGAVIENYAFGIGKGGKTFSIGEGGGVARLAFAHAACSLASVSPGTGKKFLTGSGGAGKDIILKEILRRWGQDLTSNDLADAAVMAKIAYHHYTGDTEGLTKKQLECLQVVEQEFTAPVKTRRRVRLNG